MQTLRTASLWFNFTGSYKKKSVRSAFKVFNLHFGHCDSSSFFYLKNMLPNNLNKICARILTLQVKL